MPLGIKLTAFGYENLMQGLLKVSKEGVVETLTTEAGGLKFQLTDGVDVADDGTVYFTDASSKYRLHNFIFDMLEGRPLGRLLRYDPTTKTTELLVGDLYFANGVVVAPSQDFVVFCETPLYVFFDCLNKSIEHKIDSLRSLKIAGEDVENITLPEIAKEALRNS